ncbi:DUF2075 domain-containing protein [Mucilaginibacter myungsuensis]|uniref:DUF2075 domain-containing protein n=1 Tax=Mucilaginibacter myungsuensis TaxID=649104 RepID=A0A929KWC9_9SPHI|nr:DUF2075 domain-containing protein [Mucilaginibacter myungsuensis]MBE9661133.1 DUF2075 domain-containing protein [Mucilaginibacter myungsuensis]MDN3597278.1 DUF2075 domain-containing protein [Mucilaginibacter myungsuensis]
MGAYYSNSLAGFLKDDTLKISGTLTHGAGLSGFYQQKHTQTLSWGDAINTLKTAFDQIIAEVDGAEQWGIMLEYPIARRQKRVDAVILAGDLVIVLEFKVGKADYTNADKEQVLDYCLDLRDFHFESKDKILVPVLLATEGKNISNEFSRTEDQVQNIIFSNAADLAFNLFKIFAVYQTGNAQIDTKRWDDSDYSPTPTIVEAARSLYAGKEVVEISRSHARGKNLTKTSNAVVTAIKQAKADGQKIICFITGVPGAGKTLAGLNIAHDASVQQDGRSLATFISGNAPLIKVLKKALSNDAHKRRFDKTAKQKESDRIISFVENAHGFLELYFANKAKVPNNKIVIFDEAQRAWDAKHSEQKFKRPHSEAEMMFEIMDRHKDWAVIVALIGGGQEINKGEAGLPEWGKVIQEKYSDWKVYISPQLKVGHHSTGDLTLFTEEPENLSIVEDSNLHLDVSIRSYKAEKLSQWVSFVLNNEAEQAKSLFKEHLSKYQIRLTRDLDQAKDWLRSKCKGTRRMGLVATSGARRLLPYGFDIRQPLEEAEWFLNDRNDVRSSYFLELAATEYRIQGLELDWVGVCWDLDLRRKAGRWSFNSFSGTKWQDVKSAEKQQFYINKYRVLLTRAREGMVIFIPPGDINDQTRPPAVYDAVANYLISCGVQPL